jgi:hypothetical protein
MPYYRFGSLEQYRWNRDNFDVLKSILVQSAWALLYAYEKMNFIHEDMHLENVLIQATKKTSFTYGVRELKVIGGISAILMDFGRAKVKEHTSCLVYRSIEKLLILSFNIESSDLALEFDLKLLNMLYKDNTPITPIIYDEIKNVIDQCRIRYVVSEKMIR